MTMRGRCETDCVRRWRRSPRAIERIAADPAARSDPRRLRREILAARIALKSTATDLEGMAGAAPFDPLADGLLDPEPRRRSSSWPRHDGRHRSGKPAQSRSAGTDAPARATRYPGRQEALLLAIRAALAMLLLSGLWLATGWSEGFTAVSGGAIMLFFGVNQDNPLAGGRTYLVWSSVGILVGYLVIILVLPYLQGFWSLAVVLLLVLLPAGLMAGTPSHAWAGIALGGWTVAEIGFGNVFRPDELAFVNNAVALILGMIGCLAVIAAMPVTSHARRRRELAARDRHDPSRGGARRDRSPPWRERDRRHAGRSAATPRAGPPARRGLFSRDARAWPPRRSNSAGWWSSSPTPTCPRMPPRAIEHFLARFADALESVAASRADRQARLAEAEAIVAELRADLAARTLEPGAAARSVLRAAASLRFIADRFYIDRAYLERGFAED